MRALARCVAACVLASAAGSAWGIPTNVRLVDDSAPAGGDGLTWGTAFNSLQAGIDAVNAGGGVDELWIAAGSYWPTLEQSGGGPVSASFVLLRPVGVYGGFNGTETQRDQRDPALNVTILTGEIGGVGPARVRMLVSVPAAATAGVYTLDGLTMRRAGVVSIDGAVVSLAPPSGSVVRFADVQVLEMTGRNGILTKSSLAGLRMDRCRFEGNTSTVGPAISSIDGNVEIRDSVFLNNQGGVPGLISTQSQSPPNPLIARSTFRNNRGGAGVISVFGASVEDCVFEDNIGNDGPGVLSLRPLQVGTGTIRNSVFRRNRGSNGGGAIDVQSVRVEGSLFEGNICTSQGGAARAGTTQFINCRFIGNSANFGGAVSGQSNVFIGSLFLGNSAASGPSALAGGGTLLNCTVLSNTITNSVGVTPAVLGFQLVNSIVWGNRVTQAPAGSSIAGQQWSPGGGPSSYSTIEGWMFSATQPTLSGADPLLDAGGALQAGSPAIDAGTHVLTGVVVGNAPVLLPAADAAGRSRFVDDPLTADTGLGGSPLIDRGALEFGAGPACYPNMDLSTEPPVLNALDFQAFLGLYRAGHPLANCNGSTAAPVINAVDLQCFLSRYRGGC